MGLIKKISDLFAISKKAENTTDKGFAKGFPFSRVTTFGEHRYRTEGERCDVSFVNQKTGKIREIVDNRGNIRNFPGIVKEDCWMKKLTNERYLRPVVRFRTSFEKWDATRYIMRWQIQPDGRYWADDDGFGMENDEEIVLYSFIDQNGQFMGPFRIYCAGDKEYLSRDDS